MSTNKLVILGASGFVGTTLAERMTGAPGWEVVPVIHSAGSAWRLARHGTPLVQADINDPAQLRKVLDGATHVVNCTRGGRAVMIDGLRDILVACRAAGTRRFVHLSSVMVYGDPPHPDSHRENAPTQPPPGAESYARIKLEQDQLVLQAVKEGLPSVVLCPPNISGPFSLYLVGIVSALRNGSFALMDDGASPCNLVDVRTLCHAVELALGADERAADGRRMFVTDGDAVSWRDVIDELIELAGAPPVRSIDRAELLQLASRGSVAPKASLGRALKHIVSSDVRAALRKDPLLGRLDRAMRAAVAHTGRGIEGRIRRSIEGPLPIERPDPHPGLAVGLCAQQLRGVRHLNTRASEVLGFAPPVGFGRSMADFRDWYRVFHGGAGAEWPLARNLYLK